MGRSLIDCDDCMTKKPSPRDKLILVLVVSALVSLVWVLAAPGKMSFVVLSSFMLIGSVWMMYRMMKMFLVSIHRLKWDAVPYALVRTNVEMVAQRYSKVGVPAFMYRPDFEIEYEYGGKLYSMEMGGLNIGVTKSFPTMHGAEKYLEQIKNKRLAEFVFVNPEEPGQVCMKKGMTRDQIGMSIFSLLAFVGSIYGLFNYVS